MRRRILIISLAVVVVLGISGVFALNNIFSILMVQEFMNSNVNHEQVVKQEGDKKDTNIVDKLPEESVPNTDKSTVIQPNSSGSNDQNVVTNQDTKLQSNTQQTAADSNTKTPSKDKEAQEKVEAPVIQPGNMVVDETKLKEIEKKVPLSDKSKALSIVLGSLTKEDYVQLIEMSKGGVTQAEKQEAKKILGARLTEEKKLQLKALYTKYEELLLQ